MGSRGAYPQPPKYICPNLKSPATASSSGKNVWGKLEQVGYPVASLLSFVLLGASVVGRLNFFLLVSSYTCYVLICHQMVLHSVKCHTLCFTTTFCCDSVNYCVKITCFLLEINFFFLKMCFSFFGGRFYICACA